MRQALFWFRVAVLFLWRSERVTLVLALMIFTAVAALVFLSSLVTGVKDAMIRNSVGLYSGHISATNLPAEVGPESLYVEGVTQVLQRRPRPGILTAGQRMAPVTLMAVAPAAEAAATGLPRKIIHGAYPAPDSDQILLSTHLAEQLGVATGATLSFSGGREKRAYELEVSGIYRTGVDRLDYGLAFVADRTSAGSRTAWQAAVFIEAGAFLEDVKARLQRAVSGQAVFKSWSERMPDLRQLIDLNYVSMNLVTILVFGVVALGVASAFVVFVLKNIREYGIMRAMGVSVGDVSWLIGAEILALSLMASLFGMLVGAIVIFLVARTGIDLTFFTSHNRYFSMSGVIYPRATSYALAIPPLVAVSSSLLAAIWPIAMIGRKKVVDILRMI
jgi:ABC-type lipoprotein release transport system permease subunit